VGAPLLVVPSTSERSVSGEDDVARFSMRGTAIPLDSLGRGVRRDHFQWEGVAYSGGGNVMPTYVTLAK